MTAVPAMVTDLTGKSVWVCGHAGLLGSALVRRLRAEPIGSLLFANREELDLRDAGAVDAWVSEHRPDLVFLTAGRVGGVLANQMTPTEFLDENLSITANVLRAAHRFGVEKLIQTGSSAMYPQMAEQPIREEALLTGPLDPSHESYAIAKIAGAKLCDAYRKQYGADFITAVPCGLYGRGGSFHPDRSHVVHGLLMKAHNAKLSDSTFMEVWGSGLQRREILFADDCADAFVFLMKFYGGDQVINVGSGGDLTIRELAQAVTKTVEFAGELRFDASKPEGVQRRLMSADRIRALGWSPTTSLSSGLAQTYAAMPGAVPRPA